MKNKTVELCIYFHALPLYLNPFFLMFSSSTSKGKNQGIFPLQTHVRRRRLKPPKKSDRIPTEIRAPCETCLIETFVVAQRNSSWFISPPGKSLTFVTNKVDIQVLPAKIFSNYPEETASYLVCEKLVGPHGIRILNQRIATSIHTTVAHTFQGQSLQIVSHYIITSRLI